MEDRSLDEFLNADDDGDDSDDRDALSGTDGAGDAPEAVGTADTPGEDEAGDSTTTDGARDGAGDERGDVEPATATAVWDPDGGACADCGATVRRRWGSEAGLVCGACKDW